MSLAIQTKADPLFQMPCAWAVLMECVLQVNTATRTVDCSILGLQPPPRQLGNTPSAALLLPGGGELVLAAPNACLQFYSLTHDRHIDRLQVSGSFNVNACHWASLPISAWSA